MRFSPRSSRCPRRHSAEEARLEGGGVAPLLDHRPPLLVRVGAGPVIVGFFSFGQSVYIKGTIIAPSGP